ncbi:hypothetical protein BD769DRAFT_1501758, partial [Suillus cothurnatus]
MQSSYLFLCAGIPLRVQLNVLSSLWTLFSTSNVSFLHSSSPYYLIRSLAILVTHFPNLCPIRHFHLFWTTSTYSEQHICVVLNSLP